MSFTKKCANQKVERQGLIPQRINCTYVMTLLTSRVDGTVVGVVIPQRINSIHFPVSQLMQRYNLFFNLQTKNRKFLQFFPLTPQFRVISSVKTNISTLFYIYLKESLYDFADN